MYSIRCAVQISVLLGRNLSPAMAVVCVRGCADVNFPPAVEMSRPSKTGLIESPLVQLAKADGRSKSTGLSYYYPGTAVVPQVCICIGYPWPLDPVKVSAVQLTLLVPARQNSK